MNKYFKLLLCAAIGLGTFTACEDVPEPYNIPTEQGTTPTNPEATEITCAQAVELVNAMADGATSNETYAITGYITEVVGSASRNQQTFWMADTKGGGKIFEAYWANLPEGVTEFKAGTKVKITGKLIKYVNANSGQVIPEIKNATVEILEAGEDPGTSDATEVTCAQAVELVNALADGGTSTETYAITGYITEVVGSVSRNQQTFWMADTKDGGKVFEAYWADLPEGVTEFKKGMKVKITGQLIKYVNKTSGQVTPEIKNATVEILETSGDDPVTPPVGTEVTCAQAVELTNALADGATSAETYTVTGYITEVVGSVSRNQQTFWMADTKDGGKVFEAYYADLPEGITEFKKGMKVKITGQLMKYVNKTSGQVTPEIKNATVEILETGGDDPVTPPAGTEVTCAQAVELTNALDNGATSSETYTVTGYITEIVGNVSRNQQSFWMADTQDGGKVFEAYWANLPEGTTEFKKGMKVKITGQLMKYVNNSGQVTPEIKNATVEILEGGGDTPDPTPSGTKTLADFTNGDFETWADGQPVGWKSKSSASDGTLSQSTDAHGGSYSVKVQGTTSKNKRLAYEELSLEAGSYTMTFYAKAASSGGSVRPGYVPLKEDGSVGSYVYGDYVNDLGSEWVKVEHSFELSATTTVCLVIMNSKTPGAEVLIDDFTITKN